MNRLAALALVALAAIACENDSAFTGNFGSPAEPAELHAEDRYAVFLNGCSGLRMPPIRLDANGDAHVNWTIDWPSKATETGVLDIHTTDADHLRIVVYYPDGPTKEFMLVRGSPADFSGIFCAL